jgi:hypothetical protein
MCICGSADYLFVEAMTMTAVLFDVGRALDRLLMTHGHDGDEIAITTHYSLRSRCGVEWTDSARQRGCGTEEDTRGIRLLPPYD